MNDIENFLNNAPLKSSVGPAVVSEQHDTSKINWVAGMSDPGEMIACGYLPELRRQEGEQDQQYAERITVAIQALPEDQRTKILTAGVKSATQRAGFDASSGKVAFIGNVGEKSFWHGLGVGMGGVFKSETIIEKCPQVNFPVDKIPYSWKDVNGNLHESSRKYGIIRTDTNVELGSTGKSYKVNQVSETFKFLDGVIGEFGAEYEAVGAIDGGQKIFMLVNLPKSSFRVHGMDEVKTYGLFVHSFDGLSSDRCFVTPERVCCKNTTRIALQKGKKDGIRIRHTGNLAAKMDDARRALGITIKSCEKFAETADALASTKLIDPTVYFCGILDAVCEVSGAEVASGADMLAAYKGGTADEIEANRKLFQRRINDREKMMDDLKTRYESERCGMNGMRGTLWAGFNAATESGNFGLLGGRYKGSTEDRSSRRFESIVNGRADEAMQVAYQNAVALAN